MCSSRSSWHVNEARYGRWKSLAPGHWKMCVGKNGWPSPSLILSHCRIRECWITTAAVIVFILSSHGCTLTYCSLPLCHAGLHSFCGARCFQGKTLRRVLALCYQRQRRTLRRIVETTSLSKRMTTMLRNPVWPPPLPSSPPHSWPGFRVLVCTPTHNRNVFVCFVSFRML